MSQIRFVYFDLGNVLLHFSHELACRNIAELANLTPDLVRKLIFEADLELAYERGDVTTEQFYEQFCTGTGTRPDMQALCHAASNIFQLNEPMLPLLRNLKANARRMGVLSNTCIAHWEFCQANYAQLYEFFDVFALSFELRSMKPEPAIYAAAARLANVEPNEIFFMDDRPDNVQGALDAGYDAVVFRSAEELEQQLRERHLIS